MNILFGIVFFIFYLFTLWHGDITYSSTFQALIIWFEKLVPSLFISMVCVKLLYEYRIFEIVLKPFQKIFHFIFQIDETATSLVLSSMFLGFPTSTMMIQGEYEKGAISKGLMERLLRCCSMATPGFIVMSCGVVYFQSVSIGFSLLFIQVLSVLILLLFTRKKEITFLHQPTHEHPNFSMLLTTTIKQSGVTLFLIGGYIMLVMALSDILLFYLPPFITPIFKSIMEFSSGSYYIATFMMSIKMRLIIVSGILSFAGLCVHLQVAPFLKQAELPYKKYMLFRLLQACISMILAMFLFN